LNQLKKILIDRLKNKGMQLNTIPGYIRSLSNSFYMNPHMNLLQVKNQLRYMGWDDVELDYCTFQLAIECLEASGLKGLEYKSGRWFKNNFMPHERISHE
jgi:hypothetical protein